MELGHGFDFDAEQSGLIVGRIRIVVDFCGYQMPVDDVKADTFPGDYGVFIPLVELDEPSECFAAAVVTTNRFLFAPKLSTT